MLGMSKLAGAVQDFMVLFVPTRRDGRRLASWLKSGMARRCRGDRAGGLFMIMVIILAVPAMIVVKALTHSPWGTYTVAFTIPLAIFMGIYLRYLRPGRIGEVCRSLGWYSLFSLLFPAGWVAVSSNSAPYFDFNTGVQLTLDAGGVCVVLSVAGTAGLKLLHAPRDYPRPENWYDCRIRRSGILDHASS